MRTFRELKYLALKKAYRAVPIRWWGSLANAPLLVPLYHLVSDEPVPHVSHLYQCRTTLEFERDLDFFLTHFDAVGLDEVIASAENPSPARRPRPRFHLTFDDGFREQSDIVAPILRRKGIPASFYLATSFLDNASMAHRNKVSLLIDHLAGGVPGPTLRKIEETLGSSSVSTDLVSRMLAIPWSERARVDTIAEILAFDVGGYLRSARPYLTTEQVRALRNRGFGIGAHSCDHPFYGDIPLPEQESQTRESMKLVEAIVGEPTRAFAFPFGSDRVLPEFFANVFAGGELKVMFGTDGLIRHFNPRNLPRVIMEQGDRTATDILTAEYVRAFKHRLR